MLEEQTDALFRELPALVREAVGEQLTPEKKERLTLHPECFDELTLGQILALQMAKGYTPQTLRHAQNAVYTRIEEGEAELRRLFSRFEKAFLNVNNGASAASPIETRAFTDYFDYLRFLYTERPVKRVANAIARLPHERRQAIEYYRQFDAGTSSRDGFSRGLQELRVFLEAAYSSDNSRLAALMIVSRKDTERAIEKTAHRLLKHDITAQAARRGGKKTSHFQTVDDWFRMKIVAYDACGVPMLFERTYPRLRDFGLEPDPRREVRKRKDGKYDKGYQEPGVDNHYLYGGHDQLIQLKVRPPNRNRLFEIMLTDVPNVLVDEREHVRFRQQQKHELKELLNTRREYRRVYNEYVARGRELHLMLPEQRRMILSPGTYFTH